MEKARKASTKESKNQNSNFRNNKDFFRLIMDEKLEKIFGKETPVPEKIENRIVLELDQLTPNQISFLRDLSDFIAKEKAQGTLFVARLRAANSLVFFLLGLTETNPLPKHYYNREKKQFVYEHDLQNDREMVDSAWNQDGYDLPFSLYSDDHNPSELQITFECSKAMTPLTRNGNKATFIQMPYLTQLQKMLSKAGKSLIDIPYNNPQVLTLFSSDQALKRNEIIDHFPFYGISELESVFIHWYHEWLPIQSFEDAYKAVAMLHGTSVWETNRSWLTNFNFENGKGNYASKASCTQEDLFRYLMTKGVGTQRCLKLCRESQLAKKDVTENIKILHSYGIEDELIIFYRSVKYLYPEGQAIEKTKMLLRMAYFKIFYPEIFYHVLLEDRYFANIDTGGDLFAQFEQVVNKDFDKERTLLYLIEMRERRIG